MAYDKLRRKNVLGEGKHDPETPYPGLQAFPARHFQWHEVRCHHCAEHALPGFPERAVLESEPFRVLCHILDAIRGELGKPVHVNSWFRCQDHPIELAKQRGGVHTHGIAADLRLNRFDVADAIFVAIRHVRFQTGYRANKVLGFGVQQIGDMRRRYLHIDVGGLIDEYRPLRGATWTYPGRA